MLRANPQEFHIFKPLFYSPLHLSRYIVVKFTWGMSKSSSSKLAGWRLVWGDISFFMSNDDRSESGPWWKLVWVIILLNFLFQHHAPQIIYHWSSNHALPQTFVHLEEFLVFLVFSEQPSSEHNPNMFPTTPTDSLLINYLIVYEPSASSEGLWSDPTLGKLALSISISTLFKTQHKVSS